MCVSRHWKGGPVQNCGALFHLYGLNKCLQEQIHRPLIQLYYDNVMGVQHVTIWRREFENGRMTIRDAAAAADDDDDGRTAHRELISCGTSGGTCFGKRGSHRLTGSGNGSS